MQQDNSNMEDKLRQLENQQLPDLSKMDAHWQQMQQMLDLQVNAPKNNTAGFLRQNSKILFFCSIGHRHCSLPVAVKKTG